MLSFWANINIFLIINCNVNVNDQMNEIYDQIMYQYNTIELKSLTVENPDKFDEWVHPYYTQPSILKPNHFSCQICS